MRSTRWLCEGCGADGKAEAKSKVELFGRVGLAHTQASPTCKGPVYTELVTPEKFAEARP